VIKVAKFVALALVATMFLAAPAMAQPADGDAGVAAAGFTGGAPLISFSGAFGAGLVSIGAAYGISRLAAAALESMARQPEVAGSIQTAMIIAAALIEGFTFFALFICMQQNPWAG
jgi:F-type H+-transporting ATPase subunit c